MKKLIILFLVTSINIAFLTTYAQDCDPVTITKVEHEGAGNRINWTQPISRGEVVITQGGEYDECVSAGQVSFGAYHRFTPEDLATINGGTLTQVVLVPTHDILFIPGHNYTIQIYKGGIWGVVGNRNPGMLISSQELNNNDLLFNEENTIALANSVPIDASQELWIGFYCTNIDSITTPKDPAGIDAGPNNEGLGNLTFYQNKWQTCYEILSTWKTNWCIKGVVQTIDGATVNIYQNNNEIANNIPGTTYFHPNPTGSEQCYKVEVNCLDGGVSPFSNVVCITEAECHPATNLEVEYAADCGSALLNWKAPEYMTGTILYNIYRNDTLLISNHGATSYQTTNFNPNIVNIWSVKVVCPAEESDAVSITKEDCVVGVKDNKIVRFNIYPNPATNELRITNYELRDGVIEIYDVYGRKLSSHHLNASSSHHIINISSLSSGVYFIRLSNEQGSSIQRFTKN